MTAAIVLVIDLGGLALIVCAFMIGWRDTPVPSPRPSWSSAVVALYLRSVDMDVAEFEALLDVAMTGHRPDHPGLPAYLPFVTEAIAS